MSYVHVVLYILGTLVFEVSFGLVMAVLLNSDRRGFSLMRGMFFSPVVLSMSAAGVLWAFVLDYRSGLLNSVLRAIGLGDWAQPWLSQPGTALIAIMIVSGWKYAGFYMVIFFAALRRIPRNIYEAARLDGARAGARSSSTSRCRCCARTSSCACCWRSPAGLPGSTCSSP